MLAGMASMELSWRGISTEKLALCVVYHLAIVGQCFLVIRRVGSVGCAMTAHERIRPTCSVPSN
jgi:hypothetical protein